MYQYALFLLSMIMLASCSDMGTQPVPLSVEEENKRSFGKAFGEDFLLFGAKTARPHRDTTAIANVNAYLWHAALDSLSFMPLATVDGIGGVIVTDWYTPAEMPSERLKVTVRIIDKELRSDAVKLTVNKQKLAAKGHWIDVPGDRDIADQMIDIIIGKARQLKISGLNAEGER